MSNKKDLKLRVKTVVGHMKGIEKMIDEDKYCIDIINQITAIQSSLRKISDQLLEDHLHSCVKSAIKRGDDEEVLGELMEVLKHRTQK
ncbi:metal-sensitive transcriptional regulator [Natranaerobius trueperi]|uniref:Transcriptional regulator n=1 Tax=Natranaerobius trueperi TaxID=759412 RepID=A0A226BXB5_9FIRM|nr:metal-sensitive transcriptional regulator [Natranaerobius trueperi]OWZ83595.1 transcriptional regulator [Natranaerobius trueperi]